MTDEAAVNTDPDLREQTIVRRYLDLPKYLDLLRSSALYLQRADGFADRFEGALTPLFRRSLNEAHSKGQIKSTQTTSGVGRALAAMSVVGAWAPKTIWLYGSYMAEAPTL